METYRLPPGWKIIELGDIPPGDWTIVKEVAVVRPTVEPLTEMEYERIRDVCAADPTLARHWLAMIGHETQEKIDGRRNEAAQSTQEGPLDHPAAGQEGQATPAAKGKGLVPLRLPGMARRGDKVVLMADRTLCDPDHEWQVFIDGRWMEHGGRVSASAGKEIPVRLKADLCATCGGTGVVPHTGQGRDGFDPCPDCHPEEEICRNPHCAGDNDPHPDCKGKHPGA